MFFLTPFLVTAFLYGMFCTLSRPSFYALSNTGLGRVLNAIYYGFILTSYISLLYLAGWVYNKHRDSWKQLHGLYPVYCQLLVQGIIWQIFIGLTDNTVKLSSSVQALRDIVSGTAATYDQEYQGYAEL